MEAHPNQNGFDAVDATARPYPDTIGTVLTQLSYTSVKTLPHSIRASSNSPQWTRVNISTTSSRLEARGQSLLAELVLGIGGILAVFGAGLWIYSVSMDSPWGLWPWTFPLATLCGVLALVIAPIIWFTRPWQTLIEVHAKQLIINGRNFGSESFRPDNLRLCRFIGTDHLKTFEQPWERLMLVHDDGGQLVLLMSLRPFRLSRSAPHVQRVLARAEIDCAWEPSVAYVNARA